MSGAADTISLADSLTRQFYSWERRGRGWQVFSFPVRPEPAFQNFYGYYAPTASPVDDGRRPTILTSIGEGLASLFGGKPQTTIQPVPPPPQVEATPEEYERGRIVELVLQLPKDCSPDIATFEQFLVCLGTCRHPLALEIVGHEGNVIVQLVADERDVPQVVSLLSSFFPEVVLTRRSSNLQMCWQGAGHGASLIVEFGLSHECMLPIRSYRDVKLDPYMALMAALSDLGKSETAVFQVLFEPVAHPWAKSIVRATTLPDGSPFFDDAPEFLKETRKKIAKPLFGAVVRIAARSSRSQRTLEIARALSGTLLRLGSVDGNEFIPLSNDGYDDDEHEADLLARQSHRSGALLNVEELATFVHLPTSDVQVRQWSRLTRKSKAAPPSVQGHSLVLGTNVHNENESVVTLSDDQRVRHMHVVGASGTGKSTFLLNLILQDIENGNGIGVLDPHGDLIEQVIANIPTSRLKDVVFVDPSDEEYSIGFNILSAHSDLEKNLLSSDLVAVFRRFSTTWGDQMNSVLSNGVLAFLESTKGGTLSDLRRFLIEPSFRTEFLSSVTDDHVLYYWKKEFPLLSGRPQAPLLTRLDTFLRPKPVRYMVSQQTNKLDFASIMDSGKIFLAKLSQGLIGEENAALLGSLFVSKFHQITLGRQAQSEASRRPFYLYCDEFGSYVTPSMGKLLSGARKYRLGLILSHQDLQQIHDADVESAILGNAFTRICFRLGDKDAKTLSDGFSTFEASDLRNLATGEAIARVGRADDDFNLTTEMIAEVPDDVAQQRRKEVVTRTRETYATKRSDIEAALAKERGSLAEPPTSKPAKPVGVAEVVKPAEPVESEVVNEVALPPVDVPSDESMATVPPPVPKKKSKSLPPVVAPMGKGGQKHKYLQHFLAQWAQGLGYLASLEMPTPDGAGSVDVVLEKGGRRIACEISVTSTVEQELGNLKKCLAAGFKEVVMMCVEGKTLKGLKKEAEAAIDAKMLTQVRFMSAEEPLDLSELLATLDANTEQTVRGYKVKVKRKAVEDADGEARRKAISEVMLKKKGP